MKLLPTVGSDVYPYVRKPHLLTGLVRYARGFGGCIDPSESHNWRSYLQQRHEDAGYSRDEVEMNMSSLFTVERVVSTSTIA